MRTVLEVAPAGKHSRRLRVCVSVWVLSPPKKSLFSPNCCLPKSCSLTLFHWGWKKWRRERRKSGIDRMKGWKEREQGGWKSSGWGGIAQTERWYTCLAGKRCQLQLFLGSSWCLRCILCFPLLIKRELNPILVDKSAYREYLNKPTSAIGLNGGWWKQRLAMVTHSCNICQRLKPLWRFLKARNPHSHLKY